MPVKLPHYNVLLADPGHPDDPAHATEHDVWVLHGDQLRAELEAPRHGIPAMDQAPMHGITVWLWAALTRAHVIDQPFQEFRPRLLGFSEAPPSSAVTIPDVMGPTAPAPHAGSPSSSPASSATWAVGSTPTATPAS